MEQEKNNLTEQIIKKIEDEKVTPIARWHFVLKNSSFWVLWGLSVVAGSCAIAASIFVFQNSGWKYHSITHDSFFKFFLDILPLFWLISFGVMAILGYYNIRHTNTGYRFSFYLVALASVVASVLGGTALYALGVARNIDQIRGPLPFGTPFISLEEKRWNNNQKGLIAGVIESFDEAKEELLITLFSGEQKIVSTIELDSVSRGFLEKGASVRVIGVPYVENSDIFTACALIPWDFPGGPRKTIPKVEKNINNLERNFDQNRINKCKDVRPYMKYKQILITN
ncbi:MAG: hypothetical protein QG674_226 [Patescibacteria group bacterium]|nr:hypothetical protein [Patescibacteria group bacterium]